MKYSFKNRLGFLFTLFSCIILSCNKDMTWLNNSQVPDNQKGTILGQLINDDDGQPLKGVKILFERQTTAKGEQTFVDTISTDTEGKFSYQISFPNKVKLSIRDVGRYIEEEVLVEVLEHKDYPVLMESRPRFGTTEIKATVRSSEDDALMSNIKVALLVRESESESYSLVENVSTNENGEVLFEEIAYPVFYKVIIDDKDGDFDLYEPNYVEGKLERKLLEEVTVKTKAVFGEKDIHVQVTNRDNPSIVIPNVKISLAVKKQVGDEYEFVETRTTDIDGNLTFEHVSYPAYYKVYIDEDLFDFDADEVLGEITNALPLNLSLATKSNSGYTDVVIKAEEYIYDAPLNGMKIGVKYKIKKTGSTFTTEQIFTTSGGKIEVPNIQYPSDIVVRLIDDNSDYTPAADDLEHIYEVLDESMALDVPIQHYVYRVPPRNNDGIPAIPSSSTIGETYFASTASLALPGIPAITGRPRFLAADKYGNLFFTEDNGLNRIIRVDKDGNAFVFASGLGRSIGIAINTNINTMYVSEAGGSHGIRKITYSYPDFEATISDLVRNGSGNVNGDFQTAKFNNPHGIALSRDGNTLFVADYSNRLFRKVDLVNEMVSTIAGNGTNTTAWPNNGPVNALSYQIVSPYHVTVTDDPNILILSSEGTSPLLTKLNLSTGMMYKIADGNQTNFNTTRGIHYTSNGNVFVTNNHFLSWFRLTGANETAKVEGRLFASASAGSRTGDIAGDNGTLLRNPSHLYYNPYNGLWYIADDNKAIVVLYPK